MFEKVFRNWGSNKLIDPNIVQIPGHRAIELLPGQRYNINIDDPLVGDVEKALDRFRKLGSIITKIYVGDNNISTSFYIFKQVDREELNIAYEIRKGREVVSSEQPLVLRPNETLIIGRAHQRDAGYPNNISREQCYLESDSSGSLTFIGMKTTNPTYLRANLREAPGLEWPRRS